MRMTPKVVKYYRLSKHLDVVELWSREDLQLASDELLAILDAISPTSILRKPLLALDRAVQRRLNAEAKAEAQLVQMSAGLVFGSWSRDLPLA